MKKIITSALLLLSQNSFAAGAAIYQGATASLSTTASLVTYTTQMQALGPAYQVYPTPQSTVPVTVSSVVNDNGYVNGIYTCQTQGTYSVGASIGVTATLSVNSGVAMSVEESVDNGTTWVALRTTGQGPTIGLGKSYGYVAFLAPCPAGGLIRITASISGLTFPTISSVPAENTLNITKIF